MQNFGEKIYSHLSTLPENQYIASANAINGLISIIKKNRPKRILEMGVGIGTFPIAVNALLEKEPSYGKIVYKGTEHIEICVTELHKNLNPGPQFEFTQQSCLNEFENEEPFDIVVIDGDHDDMELLRKLTKKRSAVFIEGLRSRQRNFILETFGAGNIAVFDSISNRYNPLGGPFSPGRFQGGYVYFQLNATSYEKFMSMWNKMVGLRWKYFMRRLKKQ